MEKYSGDPGLPAHSPIEEQRRVMNKKSHRTGPECKKDMRIQLPDVFILHQFFLNSMIYLDF